MSQLDATRIFNAMKGLLSGLDSTDESLLKRVLGIQITKEVAVSDGGTAATAVGVTPFFVNDLGCNLQVVSASFVGSTAVNPSATNNATVSLKQYEALGVTATTIGSYQSDVAGGTASARLAKALTLTAANVIVGAGCILTVDVAKTATTGVAIATATAPSMFKVVLEKVK